MSQNQYNQMGSGPLSQFLVQLYATVNDGSLPNSYGLSATQLTALQAANSGLSTAITDRNNAEAESHSKVAALGTARHTALAAIQSAAKTIYITPGVTDAMISAAGLAIHKTTRTDAIPFQPLELVAVGCQSSNRLQWSRGANGPDVRFVVERQASGGAWESLAVVGKTNYKDSTAVAGDPYAYRVYATVAGSNSIPSAIATVFTEGLPPAELEVAA